MFDAATQMEAQSLYRRFMPLGMIIQSLLDVDFYKFTMGLLIWRLHKDVPVTFRFTNRTKRIKLAKHINIKALREQLDHVRTLTFTKTELHYLRGTNEYGERMFDEGYLEYLSTIRMPPYRLLVEDGQYLLEFSGPWLAVSLWETLSLSIMNELYYRSRMEKMSFAEREAVFAEGIKRLMHKIALLKANPELRFSDFGTRRRFSREWQMFVDHMLHLEVPNQFVGTSNTWIAQLLSLLPMGTSAHEMFMVYSGIYHKNNDDIRGSHNKMLQDWWDVYGYGLSIALTDTYGSNFFFEDFTPEQARKWKGLRHDSGDPFEFGRRAIAFYKNLGIDPREKMIVFSDGLDIDLILALWKEFRGQIKITFGWGTTLTNDMGFETLSLVVKAAIANGYGLVKLSDNLAKAMGPSVDVIELFKLIFGHTVTLVRECVV
jgi:nicotinate phosphoribosyltransferase